MADSTMATESGQGDEEPKVVTMRAISVVDPSKTPSELPENLVQSTELDMDPYDENETELRFVHSKPTCFVVIGKPGAGKTSLVRRLAAEWKCELINPTDIILRAIEMDSETGKKCAEILNRGEAVSEDMVMKMIEEKVNSPEVAHHGYVLDDFPCLSEENMTIKDQLEFIKNWKLKPDFIINVKIPDTDLEERRIGQKVDPVTGITYIKEVYAPEKPAKQPEKDEEEGEEEEEEAEEEEAVLEEEEMVEELPPETLERLVKRPEDLPNKVGENIRKYKTNMLRLLEDYMADHDQQFLIELDGNQSSTVLFKQLMTRLNCFVLRPAAVPMRLVDPDEEDVPEDIDPDELMRLLGPKRMVAPRFRWRRSRWMKNCPVALHEGNILPGKPEFCVSFLDKIYCLSSIDAISKFMKNPRPYMMPPQPRPPCKLSVIGPPLSGKTTLCHLLADKYGAKVLDMDVLTQPHLDDEKRKSLEKTREDATETAIATVKMKLKEQMEAEQAAKEAEELAMLEEQAEEEEQDNPEDEDDEKKDDSDGDGTTTEGEITSKEPSEEKKDSSETEKEDEDDKEKEGVVTDEPPAEPTEDEQKTDGEEKSQEEKTESGSTVPQQPEAPKAPEVDATHPEVIAMVEEAVKEAEKQTVTLSPEIYIEILDKAIKDAEKEMREKNAEGPLNGGWILDNFPRTRDQWSMCMEKGVLPDDVVALKDSDNGEFLLKRYYSINKEEIDGKINIRKEAEDKKKRADEEEKRKKLEEEKRAEEEAAKKAAEEERLRKLEEGEEEGEGGGDEDASKSDAPAQPEEGEDKEEEKEAEPEIKEEEAKPEPEEAKTETTEAEEQPKDTTVRIEGEEKVPEGPELDDFKEKRKEYDRDVGNILATISGGCSIEPISIDLEEKSVEAIRDETTQSTEKQFKPQSWEITGADMDEEEEDLQNDADAAAEEEEGGEEEAEEEEDTGRGRGKKKPLGDTNWFCPVVLKENFVLYPGNPEIAAKYREKTYYFSTNEARDKFIANPEEFLPKNKPLVPPPVRLVILGPKGAGKSLHGRNLARKLGLFHISFRDRLQELIIHKTRKRIGPEYEQDNLPDPEEEEEPEEDDAGITAPDGQPVAQPSESESKENQPEEEEVEFTEEEEAIKANLESEEALPAEVLDHILQPFWQKEPFKSTGFVLEGFPRTSEEAKYLAEMGLFPDVAVIINVEVEDVINRLLPPKMVKWRVRRDKKLAIKQKKKDKSKKKREDAIQKRREELLKEQEEKRKEKQAEREAARAEAESDEELEEEEGEEEEEEDNIEAVLAEEFEEEEEEEEDDEEQEDEAQDRMKNDLSEVYDNDKNRLESVMTTFVEVLIDSVEVDGTRKPHIISYVMSKKLRKYVQARHSMFERIYPISEALARRMLQTGYKQPSRFGRWCPVKSKEGNCIQPMSGIGYATYPCIYRQNIYYLSSLQARDEFMQDPMTFIKQPTPKPVVPIRMAVIGPPKSGKTSLANRFVEEYGLVRLSIGEAMRRVIQEQPKSDLSKQILKHLMKGLTVPDELAVQALDVSLLDMRCQTRGYILDGYPNTMKQVELMTERCIIPVRVLELDMDSKETMVRGLKDRMSSARVLPLHDSSQILAIKLAAYNKNIPPVKEYYQQEHMNFIKVDGERSKWWVWNRSLDIAHESVEKIQTYLQRISDGKSASIADMCITPSEFLQRVGDFGQYCPVSLALRGELVDCSPNPTLEFAAEYRAHYYKMASPKELQQFLEDPEQYVPPLAPKKLPPPELLPKRYTPKDVKASQIIELKGYCPVTFLDGKCRYEAIVPGNQDFIGEYKEKYFYMESEEKLYKFLKLPEIYSNLTLPHKLPPPKDPLPATGLPMLGYLEQTAATNLVKALTSVGNFKPKYPFLTPARSAQLYVAYHLKAFNPKSSDYVRKKYKQKLQKFEETCRLIRYLGDNMTVRYRDPNERPGDFDNKLETFFALKGIEPTTTWLA